jgi:hypothetical protein
VKAVSPALTLLLASVLAAPALAQDAPPPFEEGTDIDYGEDNAVELGEDVYSEGYDEEYEEDVDDNQVDEDWDGPTPTIDHFRSELSPHGRWIDTPEYGLVWVPSGRRSWWRPYSYGEWIYTRHGWTFVSYDPWGSIPFHYGRWVFRARWGGWAWIPGYEWGPAWVSWRYGGGYVAWAPLGPVGVSVSYYSTPSLWIAIDGPRFHRPLSHRHFIPTRRVDVVFRSTREYRTHRHGPDIKYVSTVTRAPVRRVKVVSHAKPYRHDRPRVHVSGPRHHRVVKERHRVVTGRHRVVPQPQTRRVRRDEPDVRVERKNEVKVKRDRGHGNDRKRHHRH